MRNILLANNRFNPKKILVVASNRLAQTNKERERGESERAYLANSNNDTLEQKQQRRLQESRSIAERDEEEEKLNRRLKIIKDFIAPETCVASTGTMNTGYRRHISGTLEVEDEGSLDIYRRASAGALESTYTRKPLHLTGAASAYGSTKEVSSALTSPEKQ